MRRVLSIALVALLGPMATVAAAHHPADGASPLERAAAARTLGPDASRTPAGLYRVPLSDGSVLRTHGPDLVPQAELLLGPRDAFLAGAPERAPICATDYAMQILYARSPSAQNRLATVAPQLRGVVRRSNSVLNAEAIASGGLGADYKAVCSQGEIDVQSFTTNATSFNGVVDAAKAAGFNVRSRNYAIFLEGDVSGVCGVGSLYGADNPGLSNPHNTNGGYAVIYEGCWEGTTFMHEVGHNRGAVQENAPNSTGDGMHCNQGHDVMCYAPDGGNRNQSMTYPCPVTRFDCNFDDYFDAAPEPGEWLATHWNLGTPGQNFLTVVPAAPVDPDPDPDPLDVTPPTVSITKAPATRAKSRRAKFFFSASDNVSAAGDLTFACSIDGGAFQACESPTAWKLGRGSHTFEVRATDEADNVSLPASYSWKIRRR